MVASVQGEKILSHLQVGALSIRCREEYRLLVFENLLEKSIIFFKNPTSPIPRTGTSFSGAAGDVLISCCDKSISAG